MKYFLRLDSKRTIFLVEGLSYLVSRGYYLYTQGRNPSSDYEKEEDLLKKLGYFPHQEKTSDPEDKIKIGTLGLMLSTDCNLACSYCCNKYYRNKNKGKSISEETINAAIDFLIKNTNYNKLLVIFFGGEPLMNWDGLRHTVEYAKKRYNNIDWRFILETNGTLINKEKSEFLARHNIFVLFSLSSKNLQNKHKPTIDGKASYKTALKGLKYLISSKAKIHIRSILPEKDIAVDIEREKIGNELPLFNGLISVVYEQKLQKCLFNSGRRENLYCNGKIQTDASDLNIYLRMILESPYRDSRCTGGIEGYLVDVEGNVTVCQNTLGIPEFDLGKARDFNYEKAKELRWKFMQIAAVCKDCWASKFCGFCQLSKIKSILPPELYCEYKKEILSKVLNIASEMKEADILDMYEPYSSQGSLKKLKIALSLRRIIWNSNKHIKPIFLFPITEKPPYINPWDIPIW